MIPSPGELFNDWGRNSDYHETGYEDVFYHGVPPALAAEARRRERNESSKTLKEPWPLTAWPETPPRYLLCRDDRVFSAAWARRHAQERLRLPQPAARAGRAPPRLRRRDDGSDLILQPQFPGSGVGQPCVLSSAKNARTSAAMTSGYSMATKWPPRGRTV
jgi:hypothetical protein